MKNQFVTYEIALALKELEFDEECLGEYYIDKNKRIILNYKTHYHIKKQNSIQTPLWQQAIDWLRERYGCQIHIGTNDFKNFIYDIIGEGELGLADFLFCSYSIYKPYKSYYKAREKAILKVIELCQKEK